MKADAPPLTLERYLWYAGRYTPPGAPVVTRAAIAIAPLFFVAGRFTGFPAAVSPAWLARRGIGTQRLLNGMPPHDVPLTHTARLIGDLCDNGILRSVKRAGALRIVRVYHLEPIDRWGWGPDERAVVDLDWGTVATDARPWDGHEVVARLMEPLVAAHPEVSYHPEDPAMRHLVEVGAELATRFGLDTLRQAIAAAVDDPSAVLPFDALRFQDAFYGLVRRARDHRRAA